MMKNQEEMPEIVRGWLAAEEAENDKISTKRAYIDMCDGNLYDGIMFGQIIYWNSTNKKGAGRLRIFRDEYWWLAKGYKDWWEEIRINEHTARKCIGRLKKLGLIITKRWKFNGAPTMHIRINYKKMGVLISNPSDLRGHFHLTSKVRSITDTTTENTKEEDLIPSGGKSDEPSNSVPELKPIDEPYGIFQRLAQIVPGINKGMTLRDAKLLLSGIPEKNLPPYSGEEIIACAAFLAKDPWLKGRMATLNTAWIIPRISKWDNCGRPETWSDYQGNSDPGHQESIDYANAQQEHVSQADDYRL